MKNTVLWASAAVLVLTVPLLIIGGVNARTITGVLFILMVAGVFTYIACKGWKRGEQEKRERAKHD